MELERASSPEFEEDPRNKMETVKPVSMNR